ncbi:MAG: rRNA processing protein RimM [Solirubrobacteraceae bacterium]|nr:rRNA processing protein RimM [Solirubrobacteraceae bacterium]
MSLVGDVVTVSGVERRLVRRDGTDAKPILRMEGVSTREAIDALRGEPLMVERSDDMLEEGEYWAEDLVGLAVFDGSREIGVVARVRALPSCEVLEVDVTSPGDPNLRGSEGETLLVPLIDDAVRDVDLVARRIDVNMAFLDAG